MKKLITDRDILSGAVTGRIVLDGGTLITPAARDRALRQGIEIVEGEAPAPLPAAAAGCGRCGNPTCSGCAGSCGTALRTGGHNAATLDGVADGLYLVRMQAGQPVSVLPATGPGLMQRARG